MRLSKEVCIKVSFRSGPAALRSFLKVEGRRAGKGDQEAAAGDPSSPGQNAVSRGHRKTLLQ